MPTELPIACTLTAGEMISEQPILGWQPINWYYELGRRVGGNWTSIGRDAHNLFLSVLLQVGVIGAIPFLIGLWLCGQSAWMARTRSLGLLPLALVITVLAVGMSATTLGLKLHWFILSLALAAGSGRRAALPARVAASVQSMAARAR